MAIKLVYEKPEKLYASQTNVPTTEDEEVVLTPAYDKDTQHYFYTKSAENGVRVLGVGASARQIPSEEDTTMTLTAYGYDVINNVETQPVTKAVKRTKKSAQQPTEE